MISLIVHSFTHVCKWCNIKTCCCWKTSIPNNTTQTLKNSSSISSTRDLNYINERGVFGTVVDWVLAVLGAWLRTDFSDWTLIPVNFSHTPLGPQLSPNEYNEMVVLTYQHLKKKKKKLNKNNRSNREKHTSFRFIIEWYKLLWQKESQ